MHECGCGPTLSLLQCSAIMKYHFPFDVFLKKTLHRVKKIFLAQEAVQKQNGGSEEALGLQLGDSRWRESSMDNHLCRHCRHIRTVTDKSSKNNEAHVLPPKAALLFPSSAFHLLPNRLDFTTKAMKWNFLGNKTFQVVTEFSAEEETDHRLGGHTSGSNSQLPCCLCLDGIETCRSLATSWVPVGGGRGGGHLAS